MKKNIFELPYLGSLTSFEEKTIIVSKVYNNGFTLQIKAWNTDHRSLHFSEAKILNVTYSILCQ
jgi:hypothetical protein